MTLLQVLRELVSAILKLIDPIFIQTRVYTVQLFIGISENTPVSHRLQALCNSLCDFPWWATIYTLENLSGVGCVAEHPRYPSQGLDSVFWCKSSGLRDEFGKVIVDHTRLIVLLGWTKPGYVYPTCLALVGVFVGSAAYCRRIALSMY